MRISRIEFYTNKQINNTYKNNTQNKETATVSNPITFAYQDFNINFKGRTPESFYEYNASIMPKKMQAYLNEDHDSRKYIPPEQIMSESYKYLAVADSFEDVKSIYPSEVEPLFANLHEASLKGRSGILSDIKIAREMSDKPLFADGSDHLGLYLLRKIFLEGKTMREINQDFYEKDLNPEYKGIVTQPITSGSTGTTGAYGIKFPNRDFWNSFIATRDDYKKFLVNLPKQSKEELKKELSEPKAEVEKKPYVRKYKIKKYQKDQLKQDIKKSKGDAKALQEAVRKRFSKDDPEAAFITKYLSPIMTIAAERIHLSEEERFFAESEKAKGKKIENFFSQFWKANPELLEQYSTAITDTIELFEETYECGGTIPINNEFQIITEEVENQKPIDFVPKRFIELLDYVQTIVPTREQAYAKHDTEQQEWNEHFLWRYGELKTEPEVVQAVKQTPLEMLEKAAEMNNAKVYQLRGVNGDDYRITANLDETLGDYIRNEYIGFPSKFVNLVINKALAEPLMTEDAKLSFSVLHLADKLDDDRLLGETERNCIMNAIKSEIQAELSAASMAVMEVYGSKTPSPWRIYRSGQRNQTQQDRIEYGFVFAQYHQKPEIQAELNRLYDSYRRPATTSELNKITNILMELIRKFDNKFASSETSVFFGNSSTIENICNIREVLKSGKNAVQYVKKGIQLTASRTHISKAVLAKCSPAQHTAQCEAVLATIIGALK